MAARRLGHTYVGTEQLLLGLLAVPEALAMRAQSSQESVTS